MPKFSARVRAATVAASAFALVAVAAGGTLAASTNPPTLYACYNTAGQVALSDINQCKLSGGGRLVYWSTQGVPGPTGAVGPTGPTGSTGQTGAPGAGSTTTWMHAPFGTTTTFLTTPWVILGVLCQNTTSRSLSIANPQGVVHNKISVTSLQFDSGGSPNLYISSQSIGVADTQPLLPFIFSRIDAIVADPDYPTDGRHVIVSFQYNDQTGCFVTVTQ